MQQGCRKRRTISKGFYPLYIIVLLYANVTQWFDFECSMGEEREWRDMKKQDIHLTSINTKMGRKTRRIFFSMNYKFDCDAYKMIKKGINSLLLLNIKHNDIFAYETYFIVKKKKVHEKNIQKKTKSFYTSS